MAFSLNQLGQVSLTVEDIDAAEAFYSGTLGLRKLFRFGDLAFFDCAGVRLYVQKSNAMQFSPASSVLYFRTPDIGIAVRQLKSKGVTFVDEPHLVAPMEDHDLW